MSQPPEEVSRWQTYPGDAETASPSGGLPVPAEPAGVPAVPPLAGSPVPLGAAGIGRPGYAPNVRWGNGAGGSGVQRESVWTVPPYLSLQGDLGSIRLDFRRAQPTSQVIWVQVSGGLGTIVVILPEGWAAQLDRLGAGWGSRKSMVPEEPTGDHPVLVFTGSMGMGSLEVRHPTKRDERRLRRLIAKEQKRLR